ncbi:hypothetical protein ABZ820_36350 [Streptomyces diacarni]|uniref:hypothetical protein n=1 Tax=Streptomyces diacarni TaxID=2800381 RepID=UPI0033EC19FC
MSTGVEYRDVDVDYVLATGFTSDTETAGLPDDHADAAAGHEAADERGAGRRRDRPHTP